MKKKKNKSNKKLKSTRELINADVYKRQTSDSVNILSYAGISLCAIAGLILLRKRGKNDEQ